MTAMAGKTKHGNNKKELKRLCPCQLPDDKPRPPPPHPFLFLYDRLVPRKFSLSPSASRSLEGIIDMGEEKATAKAGETNAQKRETGWCWGGGSHPLALLLALYWYYYKTS